jgi:alkylation response protein AidB-like acyl-CoA dehydrogenase
MSKNTINFGVGFSEFFGSRDESNIVFSKNKVNGKTYFVIDTDYASHIMLSDRKGQIGIVSLESSGIEMIDLITVDKTRIFKEMSFKNTEIDILEKTIKSKEGISNAIDAGRIVTAADSLGASKAMLDKAIEYSKERKQFNRVIGSFQAVKHMCAEMASELEPCYSLVWHAAHSFDNNDKNRKLMACHAKSHISDVSKMVSKKATEVHGGMGFTDLLGLHFWFKRIGVNRHILGSPEIVREEAAIAQNL